MRTMIQYSYRTTHATQTRKQTGMIRPNNPRPTFKQAVQWIAYNDNAGNGDDVKAVSEYVTTVMVADLFGVNSLNVAEEIMKIREKMT
jgi:hypothetical protein